MGNHIHIISIQNPFPPTYGGAIDIFYRLKALKRAGWKVSLHTYAYNGRENIASELSHEVEEVLVYNRYGGLVTQISMTPYIVNSRRDPTLISNLLKDEDPILFEGLHNCYFLAHHAIKDRLKIVRTHNIEHEYYRNLADATRMWSKKLYFRCEALRLRRYESVLEHANKIAAITQADLDYFKLVFPHVDTFHLPCFFDDTPVEVNCSREKFVLYHANLGVEENDKAATWIIDNVASRLSKRKFIIAGANPSKRLQRLIQSVNNVELRANLSTGNMDKLIASAQVAFFVTFQATGIKLKLLSSLQKGAHVVVNSKMVEGTTLGLCCNVADDASVLCDIIDRLLDEPFNGRTLPAIYSNNAAVDILISKLQSGI